MERDREVVLLKSKTRRVVKTDFPLQEEQPKRPPPKFDSTKSTFRVQQVQRLDVVQNPIGSDTSAITIAELEQTSGGDCFSTYELAEDEYTGTENQLTYSMSDAVILKNKTGGETEIDKKGLRTRVSSCKIPWKKFPKPSVGHKLGWPRVAGRDGKCKKAETPPTDPAEPTKKRFKKERYHSTSSSSEGDILPEKHRYEQTRSRGKNRRRRRSDSSDSSRDRSRDYRSYGRGGYQDNHRNSSRPRRRHSRTGGRSSKRSTQGYGGKRKQSRESTPMPRSLSRSENHGSHGTKHSRKRYSSHQHRKKGFSKLKGMLFGATM